MADGSKDGAGDGSEESAPLSSELLNHRRANTPRSAAPSYEASAAPSAEPPSSISFSIF